MMEFLIPLGWWLLGLFSAGVLIYGDYRDGRDIQLSQLIWMFLASFFGPILFIIMIIIAMIIFNSKIIFKSPYKKYKV